jgi:hypothetical protein
MEPGRSQTSMQIQSGLAAELFSLSRDTTRRFQERDATTTQCLPRFEELRKQRVSRLIFSAQARLTSRAGRLLNRSA